MDEVEKQISQGSVWPNSFNRKKKSKKEENQALEAQ